MIDLKKAQVGALLKVMGKDEGRSVLMHAKIDMWDDKAVLVVTDGYVLAMLYIDSEDAQPIMGKLIRRDAIERWYKLATGRNRLTTQELVAVSNDDYAKHGEYANPSYPIWKNIIPTGNSVEQTQVKFNADYLKTLQDLHDDGALSWELTGRLAPMVSRTDKGIYLVTPIK